MPSSDFFGVYPHDSSCFDKIWWTSCSFIPKMVPDLGKCFAEFVDGFFPHQQPVKSEDVSFDQKVLKKMDSYGWSPVSNIRLGNIQNLIPALRIINRLMWPHMPRKELDLQILQYDHAGISFHSLGKAELYTSLFQSEPRLRGIRLGKFDRTLWHHVVLILEELTWFNRV